MQSWIRSGSFVCLLFAACGDDAATAPDANLHDADPGRPARGTMEVIEGTVLDPEGSRDFGRVFGFIYDGQPPQWHHETLRSGACVLREYTMGTCDFCAGVCLESTCQPWPDRVSAGRLTLEGLSRSVSVDPGEPANYYHVTQALPSELFADTAAVTARFAGAQVPAMTLSTTGVKRLETQSVTGGKIVIPYPAVEDFVFRWTPAQPDSHIRLTLNADNRSHGNPFEAIIECDAPDSAGELVVPAAMLDRFPHTSAWEVCAGSDCPPSHIRRYHRATHGIDADHDVELVVASEVLFGVEHYKE